ncbi:MAG: GNAT family N-acetyltransferase [Ruminococcaceae bacterium]|nr:GNAT family N-acetyltransferase [Oscillospiraceae bacterium]
MLELRELLPSDEERFISFAKRYSAECGAESVPFGLNVADRSFSEFFASLKALSCEDTLPAGWVPTRYYLILRDGEIIGQANIRYGDSDFILNFAGHIGYCIAPWERCKGYATQALKLALPLAKSLGLDRVILTCDSDNDASRKVIVRNGGVHLHTSTEKEIYRIVL